MEIPLLREIVIIFALSIVVQLICFRIHIPTIVGFLITGVMAGPHGFGLIANVEDVDILATMGLVMLLFIVGMEFSFQKILKFKREFFLGGLLQVALTVAGGMAVAAFFGYTFPESIVLGFLISLSSTAIVLRVLDQQGQSNTPHGRLIVSILIFQDIVAIPMMLLIPALHGNSHLFDMGDAFAVLKGLAILGIVALMAIWLVPRLLYYVTLTRSSELFILSVLTICFTVAWTTSYLGLSLSLGAFLAGLIISESEYSNEAVGDVLPLQDIFTSFFFISIGMLLDMVYVLEHPVSVLLITLLVLTIKTLMGSLATASLGMPLRTSVMTGISISAVGEFSFVLGGVALTSHLLSPDDYQLFLAVSLLSMALSPWMIAGAPSILNTVRKLPLPESWKSGLKEVATNSEQGLEDHVIIIGFGITGKQVAASCKNASIPYTIIEMNAETVRKERALGEPIYFGDASHPAVLAHARIQKAKAVAVVINDSAAAVRVVKKARQIQPALYIITRTNYFLGAKVFKEAGADTIIIDEVSAAVQVSSKVLQLFKEETVEAEKGIEELLARLMDEKQGTVKSV